VLFATTVAPPFIVQAVALVVAAALIAYVCHRVGLVPIVGFLAAGVLIGPHALGLVSDLELVNAAAEIGVILLLFTIGIEFSLERLARIKALIFGGGGLQAGLATLATTAVLLPFGVDWRAGLFTGFLVSLSSTAIVLKLLADRAETSTPYGQVSLGLLIFQDLAVVVMVLVVPMLGGAGGSTSDIAVALAKAAAIILIVLLVARRLMPPLLERVALTCSPELFLLTVIAICLGTASLTSAAGVSLSLGAFLAGLLVSESRFSHHAFGEILPLQILFSAIFFVSVGMLLDVAFLMRNLPFVLIAVATVFVLKVATTAIGVRALGYSMPVALASGLTLAQIGEFSFVLDRAGEAVGLSPGGLGHVGSQTFIAATVVLMIVTPQLNSAGAALAARLERRQLESESGPEPEAQAHQFADLSRHVIVAGYGPAARQLVHVLRGSRIPFLITTLSPGGANEAEAADLRVLRGDYSRAHTLVAAGIDRAKALVVVDDDQPMAHRVVAVSRTLAPTARIVARTRFLSEAPTLRDAGADLVAVDELETVVQVFAELMRTYQLPPEEIERHEAAIRAGGYAALLEGSASGPPPHPALSSSGGKGTAPVVVCDVGDECLDTRSVTVRDGARIVGQALRELDLDRRYGLSLRALVRRIDVPIAPDVRVQAGDRLTLSGSADAFAAAADLFRPTATPVPEERPVSPHQRLDIDPQQPITLEPREGTCPHVSETRAVYPSARGCQECLQTGDAWVHLRICMTCGHVGCCDSSKNKHATAHFRASHHPIVRSLEPGERWGWCYDDEVVL
jgi:CPA2 family monovalent cation:H+ antiporter-2